MIYKSIISFTLINKGNTLEMLFKMLIHFIFYQKFHHVKCQNNIN